MTEAPPFSPLQLFRRYARYYWNASNGKGHGMHSPFVFDFIRCVLRNANGYAPPAGIEARRKALLHDHRMLEVEDLGAGSSKGDKPKKRVKDIARTALKSPGLGQLLYRLARHYQPQQMIELGTSLGITAAYLSAAAPRSKLITIEGSNAVAGVAREGFEELGLKGIELLTGNFDQVLPRVLSSMPKVDLAYIDGNHRYAPTMDYFHRLLQSSHEHTILVFDDIHWSAGMEKAWADIRAHESVAYTIDLFFLGFVFFRRDFRVKQDFTIRF